MYSSNVTQIKDKYINLVIDHIINQISVIISVISRLLSARRRKIEMRNIFIFDDSPVQLGAVTKIVNNYILFKENFLLKKSTQNPYELLSHCCGNRIEKGIYILDVDFHRKDIDGFDIAEKIREKDLLGKIIFITADKNKTQEMLLRNIEVFSFINKGEGSEVLRENIFNTLDTISRRFDNELTLSKKKLFTIKNRSINLRFEIEKIYYIETSTAKAHQLIIYFNEREYQFSGTLSQIDEQYEILFRVGRSHIVNPQNVEAVNYKKRQIIFKDGRCISFSKGMKQEVQKYFESIM